MSPDPVYLEFSEVDNSVGSCYIGSMSEMVRDLGRITIGIRPTLTLRVRGYTFQEQCLRSLVRFAWNMRSVREVLVELISGSTGILPGEVTPEIVERFLRKEYEKGLRWHT